MFHPRSRGGPQPLLCSLTNQDAAALHTHGRTGALPILLTGQCVTTAPLLPIRLFGRKCGARVLPMKVRADVQQHYSPPSVPCKRPRNGLDLQHRSGSEGVTTNARHSAHAEDQLYATDHEHLQQPTSTQQDKYSAQEGRTNAQQGTQLVQADGVVGKRKSAHMKRHKDFSN